MNALDMARADLDRAAQAAGDAWSRYDDAPGAYKAWQEAFRTHARLVATERVKAGVAYLDETYPGWRNRMPKGWRVGSQASCPLAVVSGDGDYSRAAELAHGYDWTVTHGFMTDEFVWFADLQTAWEAELARTQ